MAIGIFLVILAMRLRTVWQRVKGAAPPPGALPT
jgi:hypothetical protein